MWQSAAHPRRWHGRGSPRLCGLVCHSRAQLCTAHSSAECCSQLSHDYYPSRSLLRPHVLAQGPGPQQRPWSDVLGRISARSGRPLSPRTCSTRRGPTGAVSCALSPEVLRGTGTSCHAPQALLPSEKTTLLSHIPPFRQEIQLHQSLAGPLVHTTHHWPVAMRLVTVHLHLLTFIQLYAESDSLYGNYTINVTKKSSKHHIPHQPATQPFCPIKNNMVH